MKRIPPWLRSLRWLLVAILVAIVWLLIYPEVSEFLAVDACLDSGGRWNDTASVCEHD